MEIESFEVDGLYLLKPRVFEDERGYFYESFNQVRYEELGLDFKQFCQDNVSHSKKGVLRGLHFQNPPFAQGKLVSVLQGAVLDVAVDLRKNSKTYGKHIKVELNALNHHQFYIPPGFAHGFLALEDDTIFSYKCTAYYAPKAERTLMWNDEDLNIDWQYVNPIVSSKDQIGEKFINFDSPF